MAAGKSPSDKLDKQATSDRDTTSTLRPHHDTSDTSAAHQRVISDKDSDEDFMRRVLALIHETSKTAVGNSVDEEAWAKADDDVKNSQEARDFHFLAVEAKVMRHRPVNVIIDNLSIGPESIGEKAILFHREHCQRCNQFTKPSTT